MERLSARERFLAYRRGAPRAPRLSSRKVQARGLSFAVFESPPVAGRTPLVCVNGGLIYDHSLLWPALAPLAQGRQLILYDQRGRGASEAPAAAERARIEHDAGDLVALRSALGLRQWDILGHSWGGGIAMLAVERDAPGTRRLVLVDAVGPTSSWLAGMHQRALDRLDVMQRAALQQQDERSLQQPDPSVHSAYSRAMYPAWFADRQLAQAFAAPRSTSRTGSGVAATLRRDGYDWRGLIRAIKAPTLVLHGERDLLPPSAAHELAALIPEARLELIPECGHLPFWESPETFFRTVGAFLDAP